MQPHFLQNIHPLAYQQLILNGISTAVSDNQIETELSVDSEKQNEAELSVDSENENDNEKDIGALLSEFVANNPNHPAHFLYQHILNIPSPPDKHLKRWAPFKNGIHFLLYLTGRSHKFLGHSVEAMMNNFINILWTMASLTTDYGFNGIFDPSCNLNDILPKTWSTIKNYDNLIPVFPVSTKTIMVNIKLDPVKDKSIINDGKQQNSQEMKDNVVSPGVHFYPHENPNQKSAYNLKLYHPYKPQLFSLVYQNPVYWTAYQNLTGQFLRSIDYQKFRKTCANFPKCHRFSNKCNRCLNYKVSNVQSSQWIEYHNILQHGDFIPELYNGTTIFINDILYYQGNPAMLLYVKKINVKLHSGLCKLQYETQKTIKHNYSQACVKEAQYEIECDIIRKRLIPNIGLVWCIVIKSKIKSVQSNDKYLHSAVKRSKIRYELVPPVQFRQISVLPPPPYQAHAVAHQNPHIFWNLSHDGKPVGSGLKKGLEMTYITIANSKFPKNDQNIIRFTITDKEIPHRYVGALVMEEFQHFTANQGIVFVVKDPNSRVGFTQKISGELTISVGDLDAVQDDRLSPKCSTQNRNDGKTFCSTSDTNFFKFARPHSRTMKHMIHYIHKKKVHQFVHQVLIPRRTDHIKCQQAGISCFSKYPSGLASRGFGVSNKPNELYVDYNHKPYPFNFQISTVNCYFHNIAAKGCTMDRCMHQLMKKYTYKNMSQTYNCLKDYYLQTNAKNHAIRPPSMVQYNQLFKPQQMHHAIAKWFFAMISFSTLFGYIDYVKVSIRYLNVITRLLHVESEKQRLEILRQCKQVYRELKSVFTTTVLNTPKGRIMKDIIDIDLFFFANQNIMQNFFTEFAHQKVSLLWEKRSNHTKTTFQSSQNETVQVQNFHIFQWFSTFAGIKYMFQGGCWGQDLQYSMGSACIELKNPHNKAQKHSLVQSFLDNEFLSSVYQLCHQTMVGLKYSGNAFPLVMFKLYEIYLKCDKWKIYYQDTPFNYVKICNKIRTHTTTFWNNYLDNELRQLLIAQFRFQPNVVLRSGDFECTPVHKVIFNNAQKSNIIEICSSEANYMQYSPQDIWIYVQTTHARLLNLKQIWRIVHTQTNQTRYFAFGDFYRYTTANTNTESFTNYYQNSQWMPNFNKTSGKLNTKWCVANCESFVESVFITHEHTYDEMSTPLQPMIRRASQFSYKWQIDWVQHMRHNYFHEIKHYYENQAALSNDVPCGPVALCTIHQTIDSCRTTKLTWLCNTSNNDTFIIWDSQHSFIPGLWSNCQQQIELYHS